MELVSATFRLDNTDRDMLMREFQFWQSASLAVPMRRLWVGDDWWPSRMRESVLADIAAS